MKTIQARIEEQVDVFVGNLQQLVRDAAVDAIGRAMNGKARPKKPRQASERRTREQIAELTESLYRAICTNPGASMRAIGKSIAREPRELSLPAHRLIREGRVKTTGQRDQTRYFPVGREATRSRRRRAR